MVSARHVSDSCGTRGATRGTHHGDAAVKVAGALAIIGDEGSVAYLEALYERAPFELVLRALESVRSAPAFRAAMAAARDE